MEMKTSSKKQAKKGAPLCPTWLWASLLLFVILTGAVLILGWKLGGWFGTAGKTSKTPKFQKGLIIVDVQHDFVAPDGGLSVFQGGDEKTTNSFLGLTSKDYINKVNKYLDENAQDFDFVVYSIDFHPPGHCSFVRTGSAAFSLEKGSNHKGDAAACKTPNAETQQMLWPEHCVQTGQNWRIRSGLKQIKPTKDEQFTRYPTPNDETLFKNIPKNDQPQKNDFEDDIPEVIEFDGPVVHMFKGLHPEEDSYSAFKSFVGTETGLAKYLQEKIHKATDATDIDLTVIGIAYDYCVGYTATDAADAGYNVKLLADLSGPVGPQIELINKQFEEKNVSVEPKMHSPS